MSPDLTELLANPAVSRAIRIGAGLFLTGILTWAGSSIGHMTEEGSEVDLAAQGRAEGAWGASGAWIGLIITAALASI